MKMPPPLCVCGRVCCSTESVLHQVLHHHVVMLFVACCKHSHQPIGAWLSQRERVCLHVCGCVSLLAVQARVRRGGGSRPGHANAACPSGVFVVLCVRCFAHVLAAISLHSVFFPAPISPNETPERRWHEHAEHHCTPIARDTSASCFFCVIPYQRFRPTRCRLGFNQSFRVGGCAEAMH